MLQKILVRKSDEGEISIFDETDNFLASYKDGKWVADDVFQYSDFDKFTVITNEQEIAKLAAEARSALDFPRSTKQRESRTV